MEALVPQSHYVAGTYHKQRWLWSPPDISSFKSCWWEHLFEILSSVLWHLSCLYHSCSASSCLLLLCLSLSHRALLIPAHSCLLDSLSTPALWPCTLPTPASTSHGSRARGPYSNCQQVMCTWYCRFASKLTFPQTLSFPPQAHVSTHCCTTCLVSWVIKGDIIPDPSSPLSSNSRSYSLQSKKQETWNLLLHLKCCLHSDAVTICLDFKSVILGWRVWIVAPRWLGMELWLLWTFPITTLREFWSDQVLNLTVPQFPIKKGSL